MCGVIISGSVIRFDGNGCINTQNGNCDKHALSRELYDFSERHSTSSKVPCRGRARGTTCSARIGTGRGAQMGIAYSAQ